MADYPEIPHLAFPLRLEGGAFAVVEQDTLEDVRQCVHVLLRTPLGVRPLAPEIGIEDPTFTAGVDPEVLSALIEEQLDGHAAVTVTTTPVDGTGEQVLEVSVALAGELDDGEEPA